MSAPCRATSSVPTGIDRLRAAADLLEQAPPTGRITVTTPLACRHEQYVEVVIQGHPASIRALLAHVDRHCSRHEFDRAGAHVVEHICCFQGVRVELIETEQVAA